VPLREKLGYLNSLLPMLASHRQSTGLPHRIVVDEAHYFLHEPKARQLLDLDLGAYTLVTYRPSDLNRDLLQAIEFTVATRVTHSQSLHALVAMSNDKGDNAQLKKMLRDLTVNEAVILPGIGAGRTPQLFRLLPRLTPHVRHRVKYFDVSVMEGQGFVFTCSGNNIGIAARSLKEFVSVLPSLPPAVLDGHAHRGDFSRWIEVVFRDHPLSSRVHKLEQQYRLGHIRDLGNALATLIRERYDLASGVNVPG
jgi:hypothetical protein